MVNLMRCADRHTHTVDKCYSRMLHIHRYIYNRGITMKKKKRHVGGVGLVCIK